MKTPLLLLILLSSGHTPVASGRMKYESVRDGTTVTIECGEMTKRPVTWSRERDGRREDILTIEESGRVIKHVSDVHKKYHTVENNLSLLISRVLPFHAGLYYCNGTAVMCLTVSGAGLDKCGTAPEHNTTEPKTGEYWIALVVMGGVVLLLALGSLSIKKFYPMEKEGCETLYDDVYTSIEYVSFD